MKKTITSILLVFTMLIVLVPAALAANSSFVGKTYEAADSSGNGYAKVTIFSMTDDTVHIAFERTSKDVIQTYNCETGTVNGSEASVRYTASTSKGYKFSGTITLTFNGNGTVNVINKADNGSVWYDGKHLKPTGNIVSATAQADAEAEVNIFINGNKIDFSEQTNPNVRPGEEPQPVIINDRTYVPFRTFFKNLGMNVYWDEYVRDNGLKDQLITCTNNDTILQFSRTRNEDSATQWQLKKWVHKSTSSPEYEDRTEAIKDMQPQLVGQSSYIPMRAVLNELGVSDDNITWIEASKSVKINCNTENSHMLGIDAIGINEDYTVEMAKSYAYNNQYPYVDCKSNGMPYYSTSGKFYILSAKVVENGVPSANDVYIRVFAKLSDDPVYGGPFFDGGTFTTIEDACEYIG